MNRTRGRKQEAARRLLEHGIRVLQSFQGDISSFLDHLPSSAQTWKNMSSEKLDAGVPMIGAMSTEVVVKEPILRVTSAISMLYEEVDAMLQELNALVASRSRTSRPASSEHVASWMIPRVCATAGDLGSDEAFWREAQKLAGLGIDIVKEAAATSAAAARLRSQSKQAAETALFLRETAWKKVCLFKPWNMNPPGLCTVAFPLNCRMVRVPPRRF